ncbi:hypothetical protein V8C86DRAFT_353040 [Haematococcus lacustris]
MATSCVPSATQIAPLDDLILSTSACLLRPSCVFVAWSGVLTLAYTGFPPSLRTLKQNINNNVLSLPRENPGSRWPKTSLGCLRDGTRLTPQQLQRLQAICHAESGRFQNPSSPKSQAVLVDQLEMVVYECRSLERLLSLACLPLQPHLDTAEPPPEEKERVAATVAEGKAQDYWVQASRDGNRESHYRGNALGVTLVHRLACFTGRTQPPLTLPPPPLAPPPDAAKASEEAVAQLQRSWDMQPALQQQQQQQLELPGGSSNETKGATGLQGVPRHNSGTLASEACPTQTGSSPGQSPSPPPLPAPSPPHTTPNGQVAPLDLAGSTAQPTPTTSAASLAKGLTSLLMSPNPPLAGGGQGSGQTQYSSALPGIIKALRQRVDKELPGMFVWFEDASLHVTMRAIMG